MESELLRWTLPFLERYETAVELDKFDYSNFYVYRACSVMYKEQIVFFGGYQHPTRVVKLNGCALEDVPVQLPVNMEVIWPVFHEVFQTYARWKTFFILVPLVRGLYGTSLAVWVKTVALGLYNIWRNRIYTSRLYIDRSSRRRNGWISRQRSLGRYQITGNHRRVLPRLSILIIQRRKMVRWLWRVLANVGERTDKVKRNSRPLGDCDGRFHLRFWRFKLSSQLPIRYRSE